MTGTRWVTIDNSIPFKNEMFTELTVMDPDRLFDHLFHPPDKSAISSLVLCHLSELGVPPGGETPEVFAQAKLASLQQPLRRTAVRILTQHPTIFDTTFVDTAPVTSCLIGITPFALPNGRQYILELGKYENQSLLRFRRSDGVQWSSDELWVFET